MDNDDYYDSSSGNEAGGPASAVFDEMGDFFTSMLWFYFPSMIADRALPDLHSFWYSGSRRGNGPPPKGSHLWIKHRAWTCAFIILCTLVYSMHNTLQSRSLNHYEVIGVPPSTLVEQVQLQANAAATDSDATSTSSSSEGLTLLRSRFRQLSLQFHPDKNSSPDAPVMFGKVQTARAVLENTASRNIHDFMGPTMAAYCANDGNGGGRRKGRGRGGRAGSSGVKTECEDYGKVVKMYIAHGLMPVYLMYGGLITLMMLFRGASHGTYWRIIGFFFYIYLDLTTATGQLSPAVTSFLHTYLWWTPYDLSMFVHRTAFIIFAAINQIGSALAATSSSSSAEDQLTMVAASMNALTGMSAQAISNIQRTVSILHQPLQGRPTASGSMGRRDLRPLVEGKMVDEMQDRLMCQDDQYAAVYQEVMNQTAAKLIRQ